MLLPAFALCLTVLLLLLTSLIWAFSFGLIKRVLAPLDASFVAFARLGISLLVFLPFVRRPSKSWPVIVPLLGIGVLQFGFMYLTYIAAFRVLKAYQVALLTLTTPILVYLCAALFARRFSARALLAAILAIFGAGVAINARALGSAQWSGVALVQLSNLCFALGQVTYRVWKQRHPSTQFRQDMAWLYLGGTLVTLPFAVSSIVPTVQSLNALQLGVLLYLGVIASGIGFYLWNRGATRVTSPQLAVMNNAKIPLAVAVSLVFFGEHAQVTQLCVGAGLLIFASLLANRAETE